MSNIDPPPSNELTTTTELNSTSTIDSVSSSSSSVEKDVMPSTPQQKEFKEPKKALDAFVNANVLSSTTDPPATTTTTSTLSSINTKSIWGFSSWGSSLVSSVSNAAEKLGSTVTKVTSTYIDNVYATLDPEYNSPTVSTLTKQPTVPSSSTNAPPSDTPSESSSSSKTKKDSELDTIGSPKPKLLQAAGETAETVMSTIDKTFDFASDLIGSAVLSGYNVISSEATKLTKSLETYRSSGSSTEPKSPTLVHPKELAGTLATQSVDALEQFGKRAMDLIHPTSMKPKKEEESSSFTATSSQDPSVLNTLPNVSTFFENHGGSAHLSALDMLSGESQLKLTVSPFYTNSKYTSISNHIDERMNLDSFIDELTTMNDLDPKLIKSNMVQSLRKLGMHSSLTDIQIQELDLVLNKFLEDSLEKTSSPLTIYTHGLEAMSKLTTDLCEQLLRLSEVYLLAITDLSSNSNSLDVLELSQHLKLLIESHYQILQFLHNHYEPSFQADEHLSSEWNENTDTAMGYVKDGVTSLITVLKLYSIKLLERSNAASKEPTSLDSSEASKPGPD